MSAASLTAVPAAAPAPPPAPADALKPDARGLIDIPGFLAAREARADLEAVPNPFRCRFHPPPPADDHDFSVSAILRAPGAGSGACVINGSVLEPGAVVSGLLVRSLLDDGVVLERGSCAVFLPLRDEPVTIRLPR